MSVNHRLAALLASYFDIVFALNRVLHPGEKRQLAFALSQCQQLPKDMQADLELVLRAAGTANTELLGHLGRLLDCLDAVLSEAGHSV